MSASATVMFRVDGSRHQFDKIYEMVCAAVRDVALDIGTYIHEESGVIELIVDDFTAFETKVAQVSSRAGVAMRTMNYLHSEKAAEQGRPSERSHSSFPRR